MTKSLGKRAFSDSLLVAVIPLEIDKMTKKALVVDNDFFFLEFLSEVLEKRGYEVIKAQDGKDGISKLEQGPVDFLFLELIMPKIDGKQLIRFARKKYPEALFPIIVVSGYLVEQMDELDEIGADYYIAKGTMEKMGDHVDAFLDKIEKQPLPGSNADVFLEPGEVYPRQATAELMDLLNYQQAITESAGIGMFVVDTDAKIIHANISALEIISKSLEDVLNRAVTSILPANEKEKIVDALKRVIREEELRKVGFTVNVDSREIRTIVSALNVHDKKSGWVISMEDITGA